MWKLTFALLACAQVALGAVLDSQDFVPIRRGPLTVAFDGLSAIAASTLPTGRKFIATAAVGDLVYLHGGLLQNGNITDELWSFNITSGSWTNIQAANTTKPPATAYHCMASSGNGFLYIFGGMTATKTYAPYVLWRFNISSRTWEIVNSPNASQNNATGTVKGPGYRTAASCAFANNQFYVFGGQKLDFINRVLYLDDLWSNSGGVWSLRSGSLAFSSNFYAHPWYLIKCEEFFFNNGNTTTKPMARYLSSMVADSTGNLWIYGGSFDCGIPNVGFQVLADMWKYTTASNTWQFISGTLPLTTFAAKNSSFADYGIRGEEATTNSPGARSGHKLTIDLSTNEIYIVGGGFDLKLARSFGLDNVWRFSISTGNFTWLYGGSAGRFLTTNPQIYTVVNANTINFPNSMNIPGSFQAGVAHFHSPSKSMIYGFGTSQIRNASSSILSNQLFQLKWACKPGFLWTGSTCVACAANTYSTGLLLKEGPAATCLACPANSSTNGLLAQTICNVCDLGYEFSGIAAAPCQACTPGSFRNSSMSKCKPCSAGFFSPAPGAFVCTPCASNAYSTQKSSICDVCPVGSYSYVLSSCVYCEGGFGWKNSSTVTVASRCDACAAGSWSIGGRTQCQSCDAGLYSSNMASGTCQSCPPGSISTANSTSCRQCPFNTYSDDSGIVCSSCPNNAITLNSGTLSVVDCLCPAGWDGDADQGYSCSRCPIGYYRTDMDVGSNYVCNSCPEGYTTADIGSRFMNDCVAVDDPVDPVSVVVASKINGTISLPSPTPVDGLNNQQIRGDLSKETLLSYIVGGSVGAIALGVFAVATIYYVRNHKLKLAAAKFNDFSSATPSTLLRLAFLKQSQLNLSSRSAMTSQQHLFQITNSHVKSSTSCLVLPTLTNQSEHMRIQPATIQKTYQASLDQVNYTARTKPAASSPSSPMFPPVQPHSFQNHNLGVQNASSTYKMASTNYLRKQNEDA